MKINENKQKILVTQIQMGFENLHLRPKEHANSEPKNPPPTIAIDLAF